MLKNRSLIDANGHNMSRDMHLHRSGAWRAEPIRNTRSRHRIGGTVKESTDLLVRLAAGGDRDALNRLFERLYPEVKRIVRSLLRERRRAAEPTDIVNRVWEKLTKQRDPKWNDRQHFLRFVVTVVRRVILDLPIPNAAAPLSTTCQLAVDKPSITIRDVDECLQKLEGLGKIGGRIVLVVWLRCSTEWTWARIAEEVGVAERTAKGDWAYGRAHLLACLERSA